MAKYIMSNRRAGKFQDSEKRASRDSLESVKTSNFMLGSSIIKENTPKHETSRKTVVFEAEPAEMTAKMSNLPNDVMVEPEILHYNDSIRPMDFLLSDRNELSGPVEFGNIKEVTVTVRGGGTPLEGTQVILFLRSPENVGRQIELVTDSSGIVNFQFSHFFNPSALIVIPAGGFWPMVVRGPQSTVTLTIPALPKAATFKGWWHRQMGISRYDQDLGQGIEVGVIDTGIGPHQNLAHVNDIGAFIDGGFDFSGGADVDSHGTHVSGSIGARPLDANQYGGIAPGVNLHSARVFPKGEGANQGDIANAIDELSKEIGVDLINMSLGASQGSDIERDAILDALERGTLCICAAGNSNGPVEFPAAFSETIAVSAIGLLGWGPSGSMPSIRLPQDSARFGDNNLYHANFSCFGNEIFACGPGVGIISTVPERFGLIAPYASMDGTSMASPLVCGALAAILSKSTEYIAMPRNKSKALMAKFLLRKNAQSIGMDAIYQGEGMPSL
ncbi:S8 family serine peptidase [Flagellimonas sp. HMM57]|uniref:S8 family serine peptidase n=1 Tax=unclassified Flagellimonas TaxID=2644544 RepID=UPI0013D609A1|nr:MULTISPECIES: S8 family serine peptidase [unclassified Flagellimonas]UII75831.1 S8 family serine peptidase [Flagellimonas sp. HMM57]